MNKTFENTCEELDVEIDDRDLSANLHFKELIEYCH